MLNKIRRRKNNNSKVFLTIICISVLLLIFTTYLLKDEENKSLSINTTTYNPYTLDENEVNYITDKNFTELEKKDYTSHSIQIMGYKHFNVEQAHSWILNSLGNNIETMISMMDLNGLTLEEHLSNLNTVAKLEDVDPYLILVQQIKETGYFTFRSNINGQYVLKSVLPSYYNFAGLGAVDNKSTPPEKFSSNIEGQLAQVQHLKGYATTSDMNAEVVDNRLKFIGDNRGSVTTVADLSKTWASDPIYGDELAKLYTKLINHSINLNLLGEYSNKTYGPLSQNSN